MHAEGTTPTTIDALLDAARQELMRMSPQSAHEAQNRGATVVDIRSESQRRRDGGIPGAVVIPRNVLEWRLDPACPHRDPELARTEGAVILICDEGYQSSLAAATLRRFGLDATDVIGGAQAWRSSGLPLA